MKYSLVSDPRALSELAGALRSESRIALDCEAAGFHRYSDRLCLIQLSTPTRTFLLDPMASDPREVMSPTLEDPEVEVVMHGSDYDIRLLQRDLGIRLRGLFDTQTAASLLGAPAIGLASLLEEHLGVKLAKEHQRADWAQRPLPEELLDYAAEDTRHLLALREILGRELHDRGRDGWASEEFRVLEGIQWAQDDADPVTRVKGARHLPLRELMALRAALGWRDGIARERDRAPFRVVGDAVLMGVIQERPKSAEALAALKGMSPRLAQQEGQRLLNDLRRVDALEDDALLPYPRWNRNGLGRPTPEEEEVADRIRALRTARSQELGLERGVLLSNGQISEIVRAAPGSLESLKTVTGIREWQVGLLGVEILRLLE
jgi:ribonuclease D